jgi:hypothetical protein
MLLRSRGSRLSCSSMGFPAESQTAPLSVEGRIGISREDWKGDPSSRETPSAKSGL